MSEQSNIPKPIDWAEFCKKYMQTTRKIEQEENELCATIVQMQSQLAEAEKRANVAERALDASWCLIEKLRVYPQTRREVFAFFHHRDEVAEMSPRSALKIALAFYGINTGLSLADVDTPRDTWLRWQEEAYQEALSEAEIDAE